MAEDVAEDVAEAADEKVQPEEDTAVEQNEE